MPNKEIKVKIVRVCTNVWYHKYMNKVFKVIDTDNYPNYQLAIEEEQKLDLPQGGIYLISKENCVIIKEIDKETKGVKYDDVKPRWSLLPLGPIEYIVQVLTYGSLKYADNNWQHILNPIDRYHSALMRHIHSHCEGEWLDKESNLPNLAHAGCCLLFWLWFELTERKKK